MTNDEAILSTDLPFPVRRGKVRDVYDLGEALLIVATDRISAFDCVMPNGIPGKGQILTALSVFWFHKFRDQFENHLYEPAPEAARPPITDPDMINFIRVQQFVRKPLRLAGEAVQRRSLLVRKADVVPIECVARGYLAGSAWKEYQQSQTVCGVKLPPGLRQCDKLPEPIFTPATKEETGHDINVTFEEVARRVGEDLANELRRRTLSLYTQAADYAASRGVIIADTKFEFGTLPHGRLILIDEVLTPDSSRFWPAEQYEPGHDQPSFDKQFVRNWLEKQPWDKTPPAPVLPPDVVEGTRQRYLEAYERLTGAAFAP